MSPCVPAFSTPGTHIPRHIAFIIGLRSLQNRPTDFTWSRYTAVSTETGWEPSESMNI